MRESANDGQPLNRALATQFLANDVPAHWHRERPARALARAHDWRVPAVTSSRLLSWRVQFALAPQLRLTTSATPKRGPLQ
jgi:hypothetical protein